MVDRWADGVYSYGHGIVCQECVAREYSGGGFAVQLVSAGTFVHVHSVRDEDVLFCIVYDDMHVDSNQLICKKSDVIQVPESLWGPLFTVKKAERLPLVEDRKTAECMANISVGDTVQVLGPDDSLACIADVTFRNTISKLGVGVFFGLQVIAQKKNLQGLIKKLSLIEPGTKGFPRGCDLVVTVDKIRPCNPYFNKEKLQHSGYKDSLKDPVKNLTSRDDVNNSNFKSTMMLNFKDKLSNSLKKSHVDLSDSDHAIIFSSLKKSPSSDNSLIVGDEVIYLDGDSPEKGIVRWIGKIKNSLKVEVEFENPIKSGTSTVEGAEILKTKYKHGLLLPPTSIITLSDHVIKCAKEKNLNVNGNANNNINNNDNFCSNSYKTSSTNSCFCPAPEEKYKSIKPASNMRQCLKHSDKKPDCCELMTRSMNDKELFLDELVKDGDRGWEGPSRIASKSFDFANSSERKIHYRRPSSSLDCEPGFLKNCDRQDGGDPLECQGSRRGGATQHPCQGQDKAFAEESDDVLQSFCRSAPESASSLQDRELWDCRRSSSDGSPDCCCEVPGQADTSFAVPPELTRGSLVELTHEGVAHYGVIRWIGTLVEEQGERLPRLVAGVEMEEESDGFTDGTFNDRRYFQCNPRKGLFVPLSRCRKDSRFSDDVPRPDPTINYGQIDCPAVEGTVPPINRKEDIESVCGKNRGIQGHHNSCYLDATLFSMFAFTSVFDSLLYRPPGKHDIPQYAEVQRVLREEIVNPLRKNLYVRADRVMKLRTLLDKLSSVSGLTSEEKDPEEFLNSLLAQILKAEPFLKLISGQEAFHHQLFVEKDDRLNFPSVQQLFEQSFVTSDIKLKQIPSCLIIQMPRFGKSFKMYSRILPPQLLDVTDVIENSPRQCTVCGKLAEYECKDCFGQQGIGSGLEGISFCKKCLETAHTHHCRTRHDHRSLAVPEEFFELREHCVVPRLYLELFAVVCIETSHYVAFVKCGSGSDAPWCFFDSMADRKGEQNGYNIPEMVPCPDLPYWLSEEGAKTVTEMDDDRLLPEHAKRLFSDAYMCMYQSPDLMMYR